MTTECFLQRLWYLTVLLGSASITNIVLPDAKKPPTHYNELFSLLLPSALSVIFNTVCATPRESTIYSRSSDGGM